MQPETSGASMRSGVADAAISKQKLCARAIVAKRFKAAAFAAARLNNIDVPNTSFEMEPYLAAADEANAMNRKPRTFASWSLYRQEWRFP
ncbi:hypothetical protein MRX96_003428 [Rhipicephalus microplus]